MDVRQCIRQYVSHNLLYTDGSGEYGDDTSFIEFGILDSMNVLELVAWTDATFGTVTEVHEISPGNFDSVNRLASYIERKLVVSVQVAAAEDVIAQQGSSTAKV